MLTQAGTTHHRLLQRRCVVCGFDDAPLAVPRFDHCPRCGCDFNQRPPRSYAEMEGLIGQPMTIDRPDRRKYFKQRLIRRWVVFSLFSAIVLLSLVYLTAAVLKPI